MIFVIILAAGKGTRINAVDKPKAMYPINGKPMIGYFVETLEQLSPAKKIVVIGFHGEQVESYLKDKDHFEYVWQREQLGTGHAVLQVKLFLENQTGITVVVNVDNPFFKPATYRRLVDKLKKDDAVMAISSVELDPSFSYGRLVTDGTGHVSAIVEVKNASPAQLKIKQMNAGLYAFRNEWLWQNIAKITKDAISGEHYLTDLVAIADSQGKRVITVPITHQNEAIGINTVENLKEAEKSIF